MRKFVDLHTHSLASDGSFPPEEVIRMADAAGLYAVALTDHDTFDGLPAARRAARAFPELGFVSGIEISARPIVGTMHMLALGVDETCPSLKAVAKFLRSARDRRNPRIVEKLQRLGLEIDMDDVLAVACEGTMGDGALVSRSHIAIALHRKGLVASTAEAFSKYLAKGAAAYVDRERPTPEDAIAAIREAGGTAVAAHPVHWGCDDDAHIERTLRTLVDAGLGGIETYHSDHSPAQTRLYLGLAEKFNLKVTGGSDFHGLPKPKVRVGKPHVPVAAVGRDFLDELIAHSR